MYPTQSVRHLQGGGGGGCQGSRASRLKVRHRQLSGTISRAFLPRSLPLNNTHLTLYVGNRRAAWIGESKSMNTLDKNTARFVLIWRDA